MNSAGSMVPRKSIIVVMIASVTATWLAVQRHNLFLSTGSLGRAETEAVELEQRIAAATTAKDAARRAAREMKEESWTKLAKLKNAEEELARIDPEAYWADPPAGEPQWDDRSPYVWLTKTTLTTLPGSPFTDRAELRDEVADTLALSPDTKQELNEKLARLLSNYHALEAAHVELINDPLPGIGQDGPNLTLRVTPFPQEGETLKRGFEETVRSMLGEQRAELLLKSGAGWLESEFAVTGTEPKTISVARHANGTYNLSIQTGNSWFSTGGFNELNQYLPEHLLPFFTEGLEQPPSSVGQATSQQR